MDYQQQPHHYMRPPPPPSTADPYHHHQQQQLGQPPVPPPPAPWYPAQQFQYHQPPSQQHSPPPPPPHHPQWAPPPPYPAPPPYHAHPLHDQYQQHPPPYHANPQIPQSYPQDWGNANWGHHQGWEYPEDWAAKARAWAAANATTDYQHSQSQNYQDQYPQTSDPHYPDVLQPSNQASSYQQYPPPAAPSHRPHMAHLQESASISAGQSSFVPENYLSYSARDGNLAGNSNAVFPPQKSSPTSSSVHLQEVPSSYSSVTGIKEAGDQNEQFYRSFPLPVDSNQAPHHVNPPLPAIGRSISIEQPHYAVGSQSTEASTDLSDQPLVFSHGFNHNRDPRTQPSYIHTDSGAATSSHSWITPAVPGTVFPPIPPHDPPIPSSVPGHSAALFGRMPGQSFQPTVPSVGTPFGIGAGSGHHPTTVFTPDVYGVPERPKKASVPNWLREEIIKNKSAITTSSLEHPKEETESIEDEAVDKSLGKADQADSKSIDSSKSTEEEDDDEDDVEAARTVAINQEIKRILTEVLLKVTDELFDEIATKVLNEDDLTVEIDQNVVGPNPKLSPSASAFPTPKASAKVLVPAKAEGPENEDGNGKSTSMSPGDVLGLGSYASDDDEDDNNTVHPQPSTRKLSEEKHLVENGRSQEETEGRKDLRKEEGGTIKLAPNGHTISNGDSVNELSEKRTSRMSPDGNIGSRYTSRTVVGAEEDEDNFRRDKRLESGDASRTDHVIGEKAVITESPLDNTNSKKQVMDEARGKETRNKQDKDDTHGQVKRSSYGKDIVKEAASGKGRTDEREDERRRRQDERHMKRERERTDDRNGSKEKMKEQGGNSREKAKESDSRKRSIHPDVKEDRKEKERDRRANAEDDGDRRRELTKDEKGERSRHRLASESSRHKRRRSSSVGSRGKSSKDNSVVSHANDSSEELSDDSKRKLHSKRRNLSPSPNRSRRRQDSRSPHSKHSQRRHSPYSSLETTRRRRSRSRSPVRRQR
ncbi:uncharacterized protein LOC131311940 isoform X2 [Rhododendron vialii]|uniref:uncharacterized protein LOC131311940 isoform X2 n=1 Tax=Rhododendron vialii TaxID=182163 RepID=UPI00265F7F4A|nr:uncharacterized protein LOC131311940 isoform X2 [Rhododendron vialii]